MVILFNKLINKTYFLSNLRLLKLLGGLNINDKDSKLGTILADIFKQLGKKV